MAEKAFESKFNQLVQNELSQKFPRALPARIGFQLITKEDLPNGNEKAVGVTALKINDVRAYIPAVFQDNEIKGLDLMWIYEPDLFVPANGGWLKRLEDPGTRLNSMGRAPTDAEDKGSSAPDNTIISHSFFLRGKQAGLDKTADRRPMLPAEYCVDVSVRDILSDIPGFGTDKTAEAITHPDVANTVIERFGEEYLYDLVGDIGFSKQAYNVVNTDDPEEAAKVSKMARVFIISGPASEGAEELSDAERKILMKNEAYVKDDRDPASLGKLYRIQPSSSMQVPDKSGLYDLMTVDGKTEKCMVIFGRVRKHDGLIGKGPAAGGSKVLVVPLSAPGEAWTMDSSDLFGKPVMSVVEGDDKVLGKKADDSIFDAKGIIYVAQPHRWLSLIPNKDMDGKSKNTFWCRMDDGTTGNCTVRFTGVAGKPTLLDNVLFLPLNSRVFTESKKDVKLTNWRASSAMLFKEAGCKYLRVSRAAGGWQVALDGKSSPTMDKVASLKKLAIDMSLYGGEAQQLLKESERDGIAEYMYKESAVAVDNSNNLPFKIKESQKSVTKSSPKGISADPQTVSKLQAAAEDGDEDVFELEILKNLLMVADSNEIDKDTLDEITGAMDACGRRLYKLYWDADVFKEEKGAGDLKKLESKLLTLFKELGDTVLLMQESKPGK